MDTHGTSRSPKLRNHFGSSLANTHETCYLPLICQTSLGCVHMWVCVCVCVCQWTLDAVQSALPSELPMLEFKCLRQILSCTELNDPFVQLIPQEQKNVWDMKRENRIFTKSNPFWNWIMNLSSSQLDSQEAGRLVAFALLLVLRSAAGF